MQAYLAAMREPKLIIVANRLPVSVSKEKGKLKFSPSSGGLATAMSSIVSETQGSVWIGWPGISSDKLTAADKAQITKKLLSYGCRPVFLNDRQIKDFYGGYCNSTVWPLFHYFEYLTKYKNKYWLSYQKINDLYKKAVAREASQNDHIWVHDYHLMLLPAMLRQSLPRAAIGFFLHIPFPSYEIFRLLPNRNEVLEGLLGADLIGFHIYDYARYFLSSASRILGIDNRHGLVESKDRLIWVDTFPIGIDYDKFLTMQDSPDTQKEIGLIKAAYAKQKIILSVDRLDYTKGILQRLEAFDLLLKEHPRLIKKVTLIMVTVPSRTKVQTYRQLKRDIDQAVGRINGKYATSDWTPITYRFKNLSFENTLALYHQADVALITPLRDGMNLVAKEYVATKQAGNGILILSDTAGAIDELHEALHVSPHDVLSIKAALIKALTMPSDEQRRRLQTMQQRLSAYTVHDWTTDFIEQLKDIKAIQAEQTSKLLTSQTKRVILDAFAKSKRRLVILDYDGTLQQFFKSPDPNVAKPSETLKDLIKKLADQPNTQLCIVSGRTHQALQSWFGDLPIKLIAEHGAWIKNNDKWISSRNSFVKHKRRLLPLLRQYARRTAGSQIEEKDYSLVWHYRNVPAELAYVRNISLKKNLAALLAGSKTQIYNGNKIIEIKPRHINKGAAVRKLLSRPRADFVMCIGDDYTDEDMYHILPKNAFTIKVGLGATDARFRLADIDAALNLLKKIANVRTKKDNIYFSQNRLLRSSKLPRK